VIETSFVYESVYISLAKQYLLFATMCIRMNVQVYFRT